MSTPKHNFELLASRTVSQAIAEEGCASPLPASPLDSISPSWYPRFPRFSTTTESSHPDLSADEVTSTKISFDEEGIVHSRTSSNNSNTPSGKRQKLQITLHRAVSTPTLSLRRLGGRIKRAPSILLSTRKPKLRPQSISEDEAGVCLTYCRRTDWHANASGCYSTSRKQRCHELLAIIISPRSDGPPKGTVNLTVWCLKG